MTVYKYFIKIALRNKWVIFSYTLIFFILAIMNTSNPTQGELSFTETQLNIGIVDNSNSPLSNSLKAYLEEKNNLVDLFPEQDLIREQIFLEILDAVVVIPEDFEARVIAKEKAIEIFRDERKVESLQVENLIHKFLLFSNASYDEGKFDLADVRSALGEKIQVHMMIEDNDGIDDMVREWFRYYFNFTGYVIVACYVSVLGLVMSDFTDYNIENRRRISSKTFLKFNRELYLGQLSLAGFITSIFILGSIIIRGKYIGEVNFSIYFINTIVFSFSILCLTFLINNITRNKFAINGISAVLSLGTSFISGVMVPQQLLGDRVLTIAKFFPTYYFVRINDMQASSLVDIRNDIFMQVLFGIVFLMLGLYFSKAAQKA